MELLILTLERAVQRHRLRLSRRGAQAAGPGRLAGRAHGREPRDRPGDPAGGPGRGIRTSRCSSRARPAPGKELVARAIHQQSRAGGLLRRRWTTAPSRRRWWMRVLRSRARHVRQHPGRPGGPPARQGRPPCSSTRSATCPSPRGPTLRALEQREVHPLGGARAVTVDARIIAATNSELEESVSGRFRAGLYYRLSEFADHAAPLRSRRRGHHAPLAALPRRGEHGAAPVRRRYTGQKAIQVFRRDWPGNVRELATVVKAALRDRRGPGPSASRPSARRPATARAGAEPVGEDLRCGRSPSWPRSRPSARSSPRRRFESTKGDKAQLRGSCNRPDTPTRSEALSISTAGFWPADPP